MYQHSGNARRGLRVLLFVLVSSATFSANAGVLFVHTDHLGTPVAYSNGKGEVVGEEATTPYGESLNPPTSDDFPSYTGHVRDGATGLVYMQARYYDPVIGRFISTDPVRMVGNFDSYSPIKSGEEAFIHFNRYWYANGNPHKYIDPTGKAGEALDSDGWDWGELLDLVSDSEISYSGSSNSTAMMGTLAEATGVGELFDALPEGGGQGQVQVEGTVGVGMAGHGALLQVSINSESLAVTGGAGACPTCIHPTILADATLGVSVGANPADGPVSLTSTFVGEGLGGGGSILASENGITVSTGGGVGVSTGVITVAGYRKTVLGGE